MADGGDNSGNTTSSYFCYKCEGWISQVLEDFMCPTCRTGFIVSQEDIPDRPEIIDLRNSPPSTSQGGSTSGSSRRRARSFQPTLTVNEPVPGHIGQVPSSTANNLQGAPAGLIDEGRPSGRSSDAFHLSMRSREALHSLLAQLELAQNDRDARANYSPRGRGQVAQRQSVPREMPVVTLRQIQTVKFCPEKANDNCKICSICQFDFEVNEAVKKLSCGHIFHADCIAKLLETSNKCPNCRKVLTTQQGGCKEPAQRDNSGADGNPQGPGGSGASCLAN